MVNVAGALQFVAVLLIILGIVGIVLGILPVTRARFGDLIGWGVTLLVLGFVMGFVLLLIGVVA